MSSVTFPAGCGQFMAGNLNGHDQVSNLFSNFTWSNSNLTVAEAAVVENWTTKYTGIFCNLSVYMGYQVLTVQMPLNWHGLIRVLYSSFFQS